MIPELGRYALFLALGLACIQMLAPFIVRSSKNNASLVLAQSATYAQTGFIVLAFIALGYAFWRNDFSVTYVAAHSNIHLPLIYRLCAIWGGHEGSLLLWVLLLGGWSSALARYTRAPLTSDFLTCVLSLLGFLSIGFLLFILMTSDPFNRMLPAPYTEGHDLNPLLQDPGLVSHPPMLYMGYVGFAVAFACAMAALIKKRFDTVWARMARQFSVLAWSFLTLGITLGSWWAYRELGWGGWWFWDPVENASLMPWLTGTALIHSLVVCEKRQTLKAWTLLLAIITFSLSLLGTFIVRSGILISVHAFAVDPRRGLYVLAFLSVVIGSALAVFAIRGRHLLTTHSFSMASRETLILSNNVMLVVAMLTVLLGTLYPVIIQALGLGRLSVGAPYFNTVVVPVLVPMLLLMPWASFFAWNRTDLKKMCFRMLPWLLGALGLSAVLYGLNTSVLTLKATFGLFIAFWIILATLLPFLGRFLSDRYAYSTAWRRGGMSLAHCGVALCIVGITLSSLLQQHQDAHMRLGDTVHLAQYQFNLKSLKPIQGSNYHGVKAILHVTKGGHPVAELMPEKRVYPAAQSALSKSAIAVNPFRDLYVALAGPVGHHQWAFRFYYKPFVRWIWVGGLWIVLGGLLTSFALRIKPHS